MPDTSDVAPPSSGDITPARGFALRRDEQIRAMEGRHLTGVSIIGWQKSSFIDFPGTVSTVLFLSGCNLRCPYCHNPGVVLGQYEPVPFDDIRRHLIKRKGIIEGAVISGGEPTLQGGLKNLCDELKSLGVKIKIDTNGLEPDAIYDCRPDYLALDIKTSLKKYSRLYSRGGTHNDCAERLGMSIDLAKKMGGNAEIRITAVPGIINSDDIDSLLVELRGVNKIFIQQFVPAEQMLDLSYRSIKPYDARELERWRDNFLSAGIDCRIRE